MVQAFYAKMRAELQGKIKTVRLTGRRSKKGAVIIDELAAINRVLAGDKQAFRPLVEAYSRLVFTSVVKIVRDSEAAQDIAQEAFLQAYRSLANFRSESAFSTWLVRIAINKALDYCRRQRRLPRMEEIPEGLPGDGCGPEGQVLAQEEVSDAKTDPGFARYLSPGHHQYYFRSVLPKLPRTRHHRKAVESRLYRAKAY